MKSFVSLSPETIAGLLNDGQRAFLCDLPPDGSWLEFFAPRYRKFGDEALRGFGSSGLVEGEYQDPAPRHRLTALGAAVQQVLRSSPGGER